ncbi:MAG: hypothetical protein ABH950_01515 [Candidatus Altiarchaeota archaeon]
MVSFARNVELDVAKFVYSFGLILVAFTATYFTQLALSPTGSVHMSLEEGNYLYLPVLLVISVVVLVFLYKAWKGVWSKVFTNKPTNDMTRDVSISAFLGIAFEALRRFYEQRIIQACFSTFSTHFLGCTSITLVAIVMALVVSLYINFGDS